MSRPLFNPKRDRTSWANELGISTEALDIYLASDVIDLHIDSYIWTRTLGYDLHARHSEKVFSGLFFNQVDFPRVREAELTGGIWSITTNPFRTALRRGEVFSDHIREFLSIIERTPNQLRLIRTVSDYKKAKAAGAHGVWLGVQGGNAFEADPLLFESFWESLTKVTLVHLTNSVYGSTSSPLGMRKEKSLTPAGADFVRLLNEKRVFVDLAHISRKGFFEAVSIHDKTQPLLVSHTGITSAFEHWRNIDDQQLRAVADTGGVVGVIFHSGFLSKTKGRVELTRIVDHLEKIVSTIGEDYAAVGSDFDGGIVTPRDLRSVLALPKLAQAMLDRGWKAERIQKILGGNFLRALALLRP